MSTKLSPELKPSLTLSWLAAFGDDDSGHTKLTPRESATCRRANCGPLANRRPELYEEDEFTSDEYER
jgi:small subunit ribosomal protein S1